MWEMLGLAEQGRGKYPSGILDQSSADSWRENEPCILLRNSQIPVNVYELGPK